MLHLYINQYLLPVYLYLFPVPVYVPEVSYTCIVCNTAELQLLGKKERSITSPSGIV